MSAMFSDDEAALLEILHRALPNLSDDALRIFWAAFKSEAIHRLAVERKPLDLGFVKITPLPWRQNWKEALQSRFTLAFSVFRRSSKGQNVYQRAAVKFHDAMKAAHLLAIDRHRNFIHWSIEFIPAWELTRKLDEHEYARKMKLGDVDYTIRFMEELPGYLPDALKIFAWHNGRSAIPEADVPGGPLSKILRPLEINPSQVPESERAPSTVSLEDKTTQSPDTNNHIRLFGKAPGPLPAEPTDGTGAAPG